jgi:hypothetical protein
LIENTRYKFGEFFVFSVSVDGECVRWDGGVNYKVLELASKTLYDGTHSFAIMRCMWSLTLWSSKVDDVSILLEHVDLLNCLNRLDVKFLQGCLKLLVVHSLTLMDLLNLSSWCTLSTVHRLVSMPLFQHHTAFTQ